MTWFRYTTNSSYAWHVEKEDEGGMAVCGVWVGHTGNRGRSGFALVASRKTPGSGAPICTKCLVKTLNAEGWTIAEPPTGYGEVEA